MVVQHWVIYSHQWTQQDHSGLPIANHSREALVEASRCPASKASVAQTVNLQTVKLICPGGRKQLSNLFPSPPSQPSIHPTLPFLKNPKGEAKGGYLKGQTLFFRSPRQITWQCWKLACHFGQTTILCYSHTCKGIRSPCCGSDMNDVTLHASYQ